MNVSVENFVPPSGRNKGKPIPMLVFKNDSKFPKRVSVSKANLVLQNKDSIEFILKQSGLLK